MKWGVPACQRASSFHKYTRARTCIYFRKLLARWHTGTLLTFYSLSTHSPMPTQNSTFWGWCGHAFDPRETRERPAKDPRKTHGKVREGEILIIVRFLRFTPRPAFQAPTGQHNPIMNRQGKKKAVEQVIPARQPFLIVPSPPPSSSTKRTCVSLPRYPNRNNGLLGGRNPATRLL